MIRVGELVSMTLAVVVLAAAAAQPAAAGALLQCSDHTLSVTLEPGGTDTFQVVGTLCSKGPAGGKTVQLLLHGSTYARYYWDFPYQTEHYSYVRAATDRGYATFNLDRIGNGDSDRPDGNLVDVEVNAFVAHQVVEALHAGTVASQVFEKVIAVGHSLGSFTTLKYAATFPGEAQGIILTGILHDADWDFVFNVLLAGFYPATLDPKFLGQFPNLDYLTTVPGTRGDLFYYPPTADPMVIALDESLKQTTTLSELITAVAMVYDPISLQIVGPVQIVVGEFDRIFCGDLVNCSDQKALQEYERGWFGASACLEAAVIQAAGHDLNLQTNAQAAYAQMLSWADRNVGPAAGVAPEPCTAP